MFQYIILSPQLTIEPYLMKNSVSSNKSDFTNQLFFSIVFVFCNLFERIQSITGFNHTLVLYSFNISESPFTNNRQKSQVQMAFPNQQLSHNPDLADAKTGFR